MCGALLIFLLVSSFGMLHFGFASIPVPETGQGARRSFHNFIWPYYKTK
jgi:hypothetical protein